MSFLSHPCPCGWALSDLNEEETLRGCDRCGLVYQKANGYWSVVATAFDKIGQNEDLEKEMKKRWEHDDPSIGGIKEIK